MAQREKKKIDIISVIIPAFKQEKTIQKDLVRIVKVLEALRYDFEIIVVADGKIDHTYQNAKKVKSQKILVTGYRKTFGKGHAVRFGMSRAHGNILAFIDAGMDIDPNGLSMLLEHFEWYNADIIVGSKLHPVSKVSYPFIRKVLSGGYRIIVKFLFGLSIRDTQVGLKIYKRKVLEVVLPRLLVKTYAFDIEILAVAHHLGFRRIYEAPIQLDFAGGSSISSIKTFKFWKIIFLMLRDTLAVFYRLKILHYYDETNKRRWKYEPELNFRVNLP